MPRAPVFGTSFTVEFLAADAAETGDRDDSWSSFSGGGVLPEPGYPNGKDADGFPVETVTLVRNVTATATSPGDLARAHLDAALTGTEPSPIDIVIRGTNRRGGAGGRGLRYRRAYVLETSITPLAEGSRTSVAETWVFRASALDVLSAE